MTLSEKISADLVAALKGKQERPLAVLRMVKAAIKNQEIALGHPLSDPEIVAVIRKSVKQLEDAIKDFLQGGRADLVAQNSEEINILQNYLPATLGDAEVLKLVKQAVEEARVAGVSGLGPLVGAVMKKLGGQVEGGKVKELVNKILQEN
jgi:hypothetical protein